MLGVNEASQERHHQMIDEITLCITKMRDICYGLSPAELKDFSDERYIRQHNAGQKLWRKRLYFKNCQ